MLLTLPSTFPFTFSAPSPLSAPLSFTPPPSPSDASILRSHLKRQRSLHDIDDSTSASRKKRRLRLLLITSRLSRPFSNPASHIVDRGSCKVAVWARQKHLGTGRLRRIAILNSVRKNVARSPNQQPLLNPFSFSPSSVSSIYPWEGNAKTTADDGRDIGGGCSSANASWPNISPLFVSAGSDGRPQAPPRRTSFEEDKAPHLAAQPSVNALFNHPPIPPSPLGLSNYDAFDEEDSYPGYCIPSDEDEEEAYLPHPDWVSAVPAPSPLSRPPPLPPSPSPSPPKSESLDLEGVLGAEKPVISPNFAASWKPAPLDEKRPPSPPDEGLLRMFREREKIREVREGGVWTGFG